LAWPGLILAWLSGFLALSQSQHITNHPVRIWDQETGLAAAEPFVGHTGVVMSIAFSPDGKYIVSASHNRTVRVWDAVTGNPVGRPFEGHKGAVYCVAFSPNGKHIVSGSYDRTIKV
jgi:WD40 repeat protein